MVQSRPYTYSISNLHQGLQQQKTFQNFSHTVYQWVTTHLRLSSRT